MSHLQSDKNMQVKYKYLLNFSVSYMGGGLKRLYEYAKWFHENGGACFIISPRCENLIKELPGNNYFIVHQARYQRIFNDCGYLKGICNEIGEPDLYYSYGIPIYSRIGKFNWFHLSNVLPLDSKGIPLSLLDRFSRLKVLGLKIKHNYKNADIISAESKKSLSLIKNVNQVKLRVSVNGSDDEIECLNENNVCKVQNIATVLGTHTYKALLDSYCVFKMLRQHNHELKLILIGNKKPVPKKMSSDVNVELLGVIPRSEVILWLQKSRYYISTTLVENSYNAASEGIVLAEESYISDIGPHRELLLNETYEMVSIPRLERQLFHIKKNDVTGCNMLSWNEIIEDMNNIVQVKK